MLTQNSGRTPSPAGAPAADTGSGGALRGRHPHGGDAAPSVVTIDPVDWVNPDDVDARDVRDPLMLASLVLVAAHAGGCSRSHSPDCQLATEVLGHDTFDALVEGLGIDLDAVRNRPRRIRRTKTEGSTPQ